MTNSIRFKSKALRGRAVARASKSSGEKPFCVLIRSVKERTVAAGPQNWSVLDRYATRQDALRAIAEHQRQPQNTRQYQYRVA